MGKKPKVIDPLAEAKANPSTITVLELNPAASRNAGKGIFDPFPKFPPEIFACKNLVELEVYRAIVDGHVPSEIGSLAKLKTLNIGGLPTKQLPSEIGDLSLLETLNLAYMQNLTALPSTIGKLTNLMDLQLPYAGIKKLPPTIGDCKALHTINLTNSQLVEVHPALWQCTALETLYLPETVHELPPGIGALTKLRVLSVSAHALAQIAGELSKLAALESLHVSGDYSGNTATTLPDEIGELENLTHLRVGFLGLTSLPASIARLKNLTELEIGSNRLSTVIDLVAKFPKLVSLDYSSNPVAVSERRELDKLMKLAPAKRAAKFATRTPAVAPKQPNPAKKKKSALERVGQVAAINASLSLIIADQKVAKSWSGVGDGDDLDGSDWERARQALSKKDYAMLDIGDKSGVALSLGIGQGIADVFRIGNRIVVVESIADDTEDDLFLEYVASAPQKPKSVANLTIPSKKLVMVSTTDNGDGEDTLSLDVPAKITIAIEAETTSSWGRARRFFVMPT